MCDYESFQFGCGHAITKLLSHCHFARGDSCHQCFGVKITKQTWMQGASCPSCEEALRVKEKRKKR